MRWAHDAILASRRSLVGTATKERCRNIAPTREVGVRYHGADGGDPPGVSLGAVLDFKAKRLEDAVSASVWLGEDL